MNIWLIFPATFLFFGSMLGYGLWASKRDHTAAVQEPQEEEWKRLPLPNLDQNEFELWRALHLDKGVTPKRSIEDETRSERAAWESRIISSPELNLELFPQMIGSGFVGDVDGKFHDSLVIKSSGVVIAECVPQTRTVFGGFDILMPSGPWLFEWLDARLGILMPGGISGQITRHGQIVAAFTYDRKNSRSFKRIIAFHRSLSFQERLCLLAPIIIGNYRGASFSTGAKSRERLVELNGSSQAPTLDSNSVPTAPATLGERYGPLLLLAYTFPPLFALLFTDLIFSSAHDYINPFSFILTRIWPCAIVSALAIGFFVSRGLRNSGRATRESMTYFATLACMPIVSATLYIVNSVNPTGRIVEVTAHLSQEKVKLYGNHERVIGSAYCVDLSDPTAFGQTLNSKKIITPSQYREISESGKNQLILRVHEGRLGMNWFE